MQALFNGRLVAPNSYHPPLRTFPAFPAFPRLQPSFQSPAVSFSLSVQTPVVAHTLCEVLPYLCAHLSTLHKFFRRKGRGRFIPSPPLLLLVIYFSAYSPSPVVFPAPVPPVLFPSVSIPWRLQGRC